MTTRQGDGEGQADATLERSLIDLGDLNRDRACGYADDGGGGFASLAVEQDDRVAGSTSQHLPGMAGLVARQVDPPGRQIGMKQPGNRHGSIIAVSEWATTWEGLVGLKNSGWCSDDTDTRYGRPMMPDDPSHPPDPPRNDALDPEDQLDVEAVLAEAAGLSNQLANEIGTADPDADEGGGDAAANAKDVEAQLGEVEELLTKVAGGSSDDSAKPAEEPGSEGGEAASDNRPEADEIEPAEADGEPVVIAAVGPAAGDEVDAVDASDRVEPSEPPTESLKVPLGWALGARWRSLRETVTRWSLVLLEPTARALLLTLDAVDGMFSWINLGARRIIGWIALVVFTAACSITYYSFSH